MYVKNLLNVLLALALAGAASAQVVGAGPFGAGTPVPNQFNSQYYPHQAHALNNALGLPYVLDPGFYGGFAPRGYLSERELRRIQRRQRRAARRQNLLPFQFRRF